ncbi:bifunctional diaminohydroxyphosphoribosylaminopyrimidine deaminase/5-amino-6-(5-phosphoribosylamino)uracil reductase RibD [Acidovorax sp. NCPPB 4044]|uniref:bifunctional diaminohydroxyphosphoribosylaminopyrimidine deaminase/5-amino-6-(5-phosphoribosylamino)uracil reductase RibD n=1 Tax=Acidovorax sp. NCPPB 4044 TaxID=2940490 RepID=UPI0023036CD5|nr:bifunctional diaminohydroxyphosphoribosylaminopyrimidine deaminase/5-amino-6-(5-phosphoribosylamino)uracil reductase RibD [Acidovorax sp. NCPPB 4044]MDA8521928.1 bifunctional diaminohydroxyphosphoribosylaminopyrimidine deaminase/5-amino-6-(5-phosphoribosylamino)uracil reductase RibD [Acidovorax sp. NCPPB 4044]
MELALQKAEEGLFRTSPNPRVGCVIASAEGEVLGTGSTQRAGEAHAEIMALRDAQARGHSTRGATAYVTLEPCSHRGRTGPCCDALVEAGIAKVVASMPDPNPLVGGRGFERLRAAGVAVEVGQGAAAAKALNLGFLSRMVRGSPWVRLKVAASIDGITALPNGVSQWITGEPARRDVHAWRARACAILTGVGTVLADDPRLDVRGIETPRQPWVAIVDSRLRTPPEAAVLRAQARDVVVYAAQPHAPREAALAAHGATVVYLPDGTGNRVDLGAVLRDLARRGANELHVEAGAELNGALVTAGLVDELLLYQAPRLLGAGRGISQFGPLESLADGLDLEVRSLDRVGEDIRLLAQVRGHADFV